MNAVSNYAFPLFLTLVLLGSLWKKTDVIASFAAGAKEGFSAISSVTPNILAVMIATAVFRHSGALEWSLRFLSPLFAAVHIPSGIAELVLLRPISGSGASVLLTDIFTRCGADSYEGLLASVICASTETTLYTLSVYFGVTNVKKTRLALIIGLFCDGIVILLAAGVVNWFFFPS